MNSKLNHFDNQGNAIMVDVSDKVITERIAVATGKISVSDEIIQLILSGGVGKGDVLGVSRVSGIMAAKRTSELIPLCHPLFIDKCSIEFEINEEDKYIATFCTVKTSGKTGVEMEALTGALVSLLTIYDMCKAADKSMIIKDVHLVQKKGGKSGDYTFGGSMDA